MQSRIELEGRRCGADALLGLDGFSHLWVVYSNHLGVSTRSIEKVQGTVMRVRGLDAIDGTPVLDFTPYMQGLEPRTSIREPE